jgi:uncharacterized protein
MGFRFIFLILAVIAVWFIVRHLLRSTKHVKSKETPKVSSGQMVECQVCSLHIPENEAIKLDQKFFCSQEHFLAYQEKNKDS